MPAQHAAEPDKDDDKDDEGKGVEHEVHSGLPIVPSPRQMILMPPGLEKPIRFLSAVPSVKIPAPSPAVNIFLRHYRRLPSHERESRADETAIEVRAGQAARQFCASSSSPPPPPP